MRAKSIILFLIAASCGTVAAIGASQVLRQGWKKGGESATVPVYVAISDIDINERLDASHVRVEDWPEDKVPLGAVQDVDDIKDKFARVRLYEGEPITERKIADNVANKSVDIPVGYRVASVKVKMDTAVSFLIQPGDRVDLIATFHRSRDIPQTVTLPILQNVRVFAVNSETETNVDDNKPIVAKTVTLLLKEKEDEVLSLASELASLRLSLRNPKETDDDSSSKSASQRVTLDEVLSGKFGSEGDDGPAGGVLDFLNRQPPKTEPQAQQAQTEQVVLPEPPKEIWRLTILTADGPSTYVWDDEKSPPRKEYGSGDASPSARVDRAGPTPAPSASLPKLGPPVLEPATPETNRGPQDTPPADD